MRPAKSTHIDTAKGESGRQWREGESSPCTGKPSARLAGKPGDFFLVEGEFATIPSPPLPCHRCKELYLAPGMRFSRHGGIYLVRCGPFKTKVKTKPRGGRRATSRRSAPSPGRRTRREDHALAHRPQMSSGRLILDRVARQQSPSPLHRRSQNNTHSADTPGKGDISILQRRGHFYFALTPPDPKWRLPPVFCDNRRRRRIFAGL